MTEFAPAGSNARMTKAQVRKYIKDMEEARKEAQKKLDEAENSGELKLEELEIKKLEKELDNL
ncbi:MAG: hypothetical protein PHV23_03035 [Candidatus Gracilibacteria bacterium]|nr:hypothetical protein [Candidatus Gracilibacteria bacterium]